MRRNRTLPKRFRSEQAMSEFWDRHSVADYWSQTVPAPLRFNIRRETFLFPLDRELAERIERVAKRKRQSPEILVSRWLGERLATEG